MHPNSVSEDLESVRVFPNRWHRRVTFKAVVFDPSMGAFGPIEISNNPYKTGCVIVVDNVVSFEHRGFPYNSTALRCPVPELCRPLNQAVYTRAATFPLAVVLVRMTVTPQPTRLSQEPGFITFAFAKHCRHKLPQRTGGLLAFIRVENGKEKVLRFLLCDDMAKGFTANRPFYRNTNRVTYHPFSSAQSGDWKDYQIELESRLRLFARLSEKYDPP
jgi:hypothetical protein